MLIEYGASTSGLAIEIKPYESRRTAGGGGYRGFQYRTVFDLKFEPKLLVGVIYVVRTKRGQRAKDQTTGHTKAANGPTHSATDRRSRTEELSCTQEVM